MRLNAPDNKIGHAKLMIGNAVIMMADDEPRSKGNQNPLALGSTSLGIHVYVRDVDAFMERAVLEDATLRAAPADHFYGDRGGSLRTHLDMFGALLPTLRMSTVPSINTLKSFLV